MTRLTTPETDAALEGAWPAPGPRIIFAEEEPEPPACEHCAKLRAPEIKKADAVIDGTVGHPGAAAAGQGDLLDADQVREDALVGALGAE